MNFLYGGMLGWTALAAVPIVIHWLLRDRIRRLTFGGTRFLGVVERQATARKLWLETVLMLLRAALVALLVIAIARPYLTSALGMQPTAVLLIDCSRSMQPGGRFDRAVAAARDVLGQLPGSERVLIGAVGSTASPDLVQARDAADAAQLLGRMRPDGGVGNLVGALNAAVARCGSQPSAIHLISALAGSGFPATEHVVPVPPTCRLVIHDVGGAGDLPPATVGLTAELAARELTPGAGNLAVAVRLVNRGAARSVTVRIADAAGTLDEQTVPMTQDGTSTLTLHGSLMTVGEVPLMVTIPGAPTVLEEDGTFRLVARVVERIHLAVVDGHPASDHAQDPAYFVLAALAAVSGRSYAVDRCESIPPLDGYQGLIVAGPRALAASEVQRIAGFVASGGGLLIILDPGLDPQQLNPALGVLAPARVRGWHSGDVTLGATALGAERFSGILGGQDDALSVARFSGSADLTDAQGSQILLRFSDQRPALVMAHCGQGVSMLLATALDRSVGDFPLRPLFLPLVQELVRALHAGSDHSLTQVTGADLALGPGDRLLGPLPLAAADGASHPQPAGGNASSGVDAGGQLRAATPGFYQLTHLQTTTLLAVNGDPAAMASPSLSSRDVEQLVGGSAVGLHATGHGLERVLGADEVRQAELRLGLGHWCLVLISVLLVLELALSQSVSRR